MAVAIYQHTTDIRSERLYLPRAGDGKVAGWTIGGVLFKAPSQGDADAVKVYRFRNQADNKSHLFTTEDNGRGWNGERQIAFYAFKKKVPGTVAIHEYYDPYTVKGKTTANRFKYSTMSEKTRNKSLALWKYHKIVFYAYPAKTKWIYDNAIIKYGKLDDTPKNVDVASTAELNNQTAKTTLQQILTISETVEETFEWSLTAGVSVGAEVSVSGGVPGVGEASVSASVTFDLSSTATRGETKSNTIEYSTEVTVLPKEHVKLSGSYEWADNQAIPFTLELTVKSPDKSMPAEVIKALYKAENPKATIKAEAIKRSDSIRIELRGSFNGSMVMSTTQTLSDVLPS